MGSFLGDLVQSIKNFFSSLLGGSASGASTRPVAHWEKRDRVGGGGDDAGFVGVDSVDVRRPSYSSPDIIESSGITVNKSSNSNRWRGHVGGNSFGNVPSFGYGGYGNDYGNNYGGHGGQQNFGSGMGMGQVGGGGWGYGHFEQGGGFSSKNASTSETQKRRNGRVYAHNKEQAERLRNKNERIALNNLIQAMRDGDYEAAKDMITDRRYIPKEAHSTIIELAANTESSDGRAKLFRAMRTPRMLEGDYASPIFVDVNHSDTKKAAHSLLRKGQTNGYQNLADMGLKFDDNEKVQAIVAAAENKDASMARNTLQYLQANGMNLLQKDSKGKTARDYLGKDAENLLIEMAQPGGVAQTSSPMDRALASAGDMKTKLPVSEAEMPGASTAPRVISSGTQIS